MRKSIYIFLAPLLFFAFSANVQAAASLSTSASTVTNGSKFTATVNLSGVASWEVHVSASGPVSGCTINASNATEDANNGSKKYSTTCKATGTGTIKISLSGNTTRSGDRNATSIYGSKTVKVVNKSNSNSSVTSKSNSSSKQTNNSNDTKNEVKSNDNTLKSLSVEGNTINPEFNKDKTEYNLTVDNDVKSIKINAEASDTKATITGNGEKILKEGNNNFDIIVTAENGETKTYKLNVIVDSKPIIVTIKGKGYTLIKNKEELPELTLEHEDITLTIEEQEVPAYRIDNLNIVLVGLKDSEGNIKLYKFKAFKDQNKPFEYSLFKQFSFPETSIIYLKFPDKLIPDNYKLFKEKINSELVEVYKLNKNSKYSLFYGMNTQTGKKNIYRYDSKEKTIQIYTNEELNSLEKQLDEYSIIIVCLIAFGTLAMTIIVVLITTRKNKIKKIAKHYKKLLKTYEEKSQ